MTYLLTISDYLVTIVLSVLLTLEKNNDAPLSNDFFQHGTWARLDAAMRNHFILHFLHDRFACIVHAGRPDISSPRTLFSAFTKAVYSTP
jgi:hypothetical protein